MQKKILNIALVIAIGAQASMPLVASDWFDGYQTGSAPKSWTDGGGGKYLYGGEIAYRFKRSTTFKPILDMKPPGIKAGCGGLSISGGFIHLLGLDEIKEQLQSATQGAMMGVIVGIVYSLPGIADAFDKVQKYVKLLQQLLSQSCQLSSAYTKALIQQKRDEAKKAAEQNKAPEAAMSRKQEENEIGKFFNWANQNHGVMDSFNKGIDDMATGIENFVNSAAPNSLKLKTVSKAVRVCSGTCSNISNGRAPAIKTFVAFQPDVSGGTYRTGDITDINGVSGSGIVDNDSAYRSIMFKIVFLGYESIEAIDFPKDEASVAEFAKTTANNMLSAGELPPVSAKQQLGLFFSSGNHVGARVVDVLLHGPADGSGNIKIPKIKVAAYYGETKDSGGNTESSTAVVLLGDPQSGATTIDYPWIGLISEGEAYIKGLVYSSSATPPTIPPVFPGMGAYISVIKQVHMRQPLNDVYVNSLISILARENALILLRSIVNEMQSSTESDVTATENTHKEMIDNIYKEIDRIQGASAGIADTVAIFEKIERDQTINIVSGVRSK